MKSALQIPMIFDDVSFGIDVRDQREKIGWTQDQLALAVGYANGVSISRVECAAGTESMSIRRYMSLCNVLHLHPMHYWDFLPDAYAGQEGWDESRVE